MVIKEVCYLKEFETICHDAKVLGFEVATCQDHFDTIIVTIESTEFLKVYESEKVKVIFKDCYKAQMDLQMWIVGIDTLRSFEIVKDSSLLPDESTCIGASQFKHYRLNLNTSNSTIEIVAKAVEVQRY